MLNYKENDYTFFPIKIKIKTSTIQIEKVPSINRYHNGFFFFVSLFLIFEKSTVRNSINTLITKGIKRSEKIERTLLLK